MVKISVLPVLFLMLLFSFCKNRNPSSSSPNLTSQVTEAQLPPGFLAFYEKFHADSLFQMAHIQWPVQGETVEQVDSSHAERKLISWEPSQWRMHHPVNFSTGEFKRTWEVLGEELVIERIKYAAANYGLERRFVKRDDGEWELIYYADMQEMSQ